MISYRQADLMRSLEKSEELPEVHVEVIVVGSNSLEVNVDNLFMHPDEMKPRLTEKLNEALGLSGFYLASDGTMSWVVNGESEQRADDQISDELNVLRAAFKQVGFRIYDHTLEDPSAIITGRIATFILELPK
jgi:hypothetical protein